GESVVEIEVAVRIPLAHPARHLPRHLRIDGSTLVEQCLVDAEEVRLEDRGIGHHPSAEHGGCARHIDERRRQQAARERLRHRDALAAPRQLRHDPLGERTRRHRAALAARVTRHASHRYCRPLTTVSTSAAPMRVQLTHSTQSPSTVHNGTRANDTATAWMTVLSLPRKPAGITWSRSMRKRKMVIPNSRSRITIVTHHHSSSSTERVTSAAP